ncbi:MAG: hypothetical protein BWY75_00484 [bacterium ADurb.Bin425]|nr:MAG: hypothetical protein BWY75_00484 [bacterium ADurb.Bin425]
MVERLKALENHLGITPPVKCEEEPVDCEVEAEVEGENGASEEGGRKKKGKRND